MKKRIQKMLSIILACVMIPSACVIAVHAEPIPSNDNELPIMTQPTGATEPIDPTQPREKAIIELQFSNTVEGTLISWSSVEGAAVYELYQHEGGEDTLLTQTDALSFEHNDLTDGQAYSYRLRALDENRQVIAETDEETPTNLFIAPPLLTAVTAAQNGVDLSWEVRASERYRVYRKTDNSEWTAIGETEDTTFHDATAASGTTYTYSVRCITADGSRYLSEQDTGKSIYYVQAPSVTAIENRLTGALIKWSKPAGADKCRLYYWNGTNWKGLCETAETSYLHDNLTDGKNYIYTVRGVNNNGEFVTDFNSDGWENIFILPPVITSFTNTDKGIEIRWTIRNAAEKYRIFYYGRNGWTKMVDVKGTSYLDTVVRPGGKYQYTVRCISDDLKRYTSYYTSGKQTTYVGVPTISSITNTEIGAKLTWQKPAGADRFRIYVKDTNGWTRLTETSGTSYEHKYLNGGKSYTYTIRCVDSNGDFISDFNDKGWSNTFIRPPVISSFTNTSKGVEIRWNKCAGAEKYRVFYYGKNGWTKMADVKGTYYLDTVVSSGSKYTYTVRCINDSGTRYTSDYKAGRNTQYIGVPKITAFTNTETGTKITWKNPGGAVKYCVYMYDGSSWKRLTATTSTSYVHNNLSNNKTYTYTVRCIDNSGNFVSDFNAAGWKNTFIKPPALDSVTRQGNANLVKWKAVSGAASYRLYRKGYNGSWSKITDTNKTYYSDTSAAKNTLYAYTLRCLDKNGNIVSDYYAAKAYYYNGKIANGKVSVGGNTMYFSNGKPGTGYQKIGGETYYFGSNGYLQKNGIVGSAKEGYCYADRYGVIDFGYCNGVSDGGYWNVINGRATRVSSDSDRTLFKALELVNNITDSDMSMSRKLRICFDYIQDHGYNEMNPRIPDYTGMDWPIIYANDVFDDDRGNCLSFAAAFAYMAKGIGYTNVYGCHSGGHGWAEIDGLIYDPEWGMHNFNYSYFGMSYSEPCDQNYAGAISAGYAWMHIKI